MHVIHLLEQHPSVALPPDAIVVVFAGHVRGHAHGRGLGLLDRGLGALEGLSELERAVGGDSAGGAGAALKVTKPCIFKLRCYCVFFSIKNFLKKAFILFL